MAYLSKDKDSSFLSFRKRTPADILRMLDNDRALPTFEQCMNSRHSWSPPKSALK
jgi:hypothetical protein